MAAPDVAALQQKLSDIHRQKDDVEKKLQNMRPGGAGGRRYVCM